MKSINVLGLKQMIDSHEDFLLVDVRETYENESANINGLLIPMNDVPERYLEIPKDKKVIVYCKAGVRSANVIAYLEESHGFENLYNLEGGIMAWAATFDRTTRV